MRSKPKPEHLGPEYGAQFCDDAIVRAYPTRPPYPAQVFDTLESLMPHRPRAVLELGCGSGDLTLELARRVDHLDAVDPSAPMLAAARKREGANAPNLHWHLGAAESFKPARTYSLACAGESLHWMEWDVVLPMLAAALDGPGVLAIVGRDLQCPWNKALLALIPSFTTNKKFEPYNLVAELTSRRLFSETGRTTTAPVPFAQSVDDYIESIHSRNGFSRDRMPGDSAAEFDAAVREMLRPWTQNDRIECALIGTVIWGRATKSPHA